MIAIASIVTWSSVAATSVGADVRESASPSLGSNVIVFTPTEPLATIQATVDAISAQQVNNQFGTQRYALLFEPGVYGSASNPLNFQVGYYTQVAGLGAQPGDTVINGSIDVYNQCSTTGGCVALDNFWRSLSNLASTRPGSEFNLTPRAKTFISSREGGNGHRHVGICGG